MRTARMFQAALTATFLCLATGCGGDGTQAVDEKDKAKTQAPAASTANASPGTTPVQQTPQPPADPWQPDVAKHVIPDAKVSGRLANAAFEPGAIFERDTLTFRVQKENSSPLDVSVKFSAPMMVGLENGKKFVIHRGAAAGVDVPEVTVTIPAEGMNLTQYKFDAGYALTLELGKKDKGHTPGKVYLVFPEEEKSQLGRSYLAGTFDAEWQRSPDMPPGADDAPYVQGKVTVAGATDPVVKVGCVGIKPDLMVVVESVETTLAGMGGWSRLGASTLFVVGEKMGGRYEHIRLAPGRYFVFATLQGGPAAWKWLTVEPGTQQTLDLAIEKDKTGSAEVKVAADVEKVYLVPADDKLTATAAAAIGLNLGLSKDTKDLTDGKAKFEKLAPGTYEVWGVEKLGTVEVKAGETAKVDVTKK